MCNILWLGPVSTGSTIGCAMEMFEKGIIDLDESSQLVTGVAGFHRFANLMQHGPCTLEADIDLSRQGQSREAAFISADEENCPEPFDQRCPGPVHNCSSSERRLMPTLNTLKQRAIFYAIRLLTATLWASKAFRPTQSEESLPASLFRGELFLERNEVRLAVGLGHKNLHNQLISLKLCHNC